MGSAIDVSNYRRRRKANLMKVLGDKCCICGYNELPDALEFHHINPEDKEFGIASKGTCRDLEKDLAEIKKCVLICANCHRAIHKGLIFGVTDNAVRKWCDAEGLPRTKFAINSFSDEEWAKI